jgi:hypothetical protein
VVLWFSTYITKKAFETARIVMSRRNVDFDERSCYFRACSLKRKNGEKRTVWLHVILKTSLSCNEAFFCSWWLVLIIF